MTATDYGIILAAALAAGWRYKQRGDGFVWTSPIGQEMPAPSTPNGPELPKEVLAQFGPAFVAEQKAREAARRREMSRYMRPQGD